MSARLPEVRPRELERVVPRLGYRLARSRGSHRIYKHPSDPVNAHTMGGIAADAGLGVGEFKKLL